jgi:hypothetical protein
MGKKNVDDVFADQGFQSNQSSYAAAARCAFALVIDSD